MSVVHAGSGRIKNGASALKGKVMIQGREEYCIDGQVLSLKGTDVCDDDDDPNIPVKARDAADFLNPSDEKNADCIGQLVRGKVMCWGTCAYAVVHLAKWANAKPKAKLRLGFYSTIRLDGGEEAYLPPRECSFSMTAMEFEWQNREMKSCGTESRPLSCSIPDDATFIVIGVNRYGDKLLSLRIGENPLAKLHRTMPLGEVFKAKVIGRTGLNMNLGYAQRYLVRLPDSTIAELHTDIGIIGLGDRELEDLVIGDNVRVRIVLIDEHLGRVVVIPELAALGKVDSRGRERLLVDAHNLARANKDAGVSSVIELFLGLRKKYDLVFIADNNIRKMVCECPSERHRRAYDDMVLGRYGTFRMVVVPRGLQADHLLLSLSQAFSLCIVTNDRFGEEQFRRQFKFLDNGKRLMGVKLMTALGENGRKVACHGEIPSLGEKFYCHLEISQHEDSRGADNNAATNTNRKARQ